uniref:Inhibitor I9 domain-containing protein n=1 Tax=Oryza brachyantha TaxID=4533 RepID=J3LK71_ORYBR
MAVFLLLLIVSFLSFYPIQATQESHSHVHIVYLGHNDGLNASLAAKVHLQLLSRVFTDPDEARDAILYSYSYGFSGFAALLNSTQAAKLSAEEVISVFRSRMLELHTTRSWDFMGLNLHIQMEQSAGMQLKFGDDIVVGILDTGVWPESQSFRDDSHLGDIPSSWHGTCVAGEEFDPATACNRKLIGARYYLAGFESEVGPLNTSGGAEYRSPRDRVGHGTHTASTALGVPVVFSAGNDGPDAGTVQNVSPWVITVAASTIDRRFPTVITLGNNVSLVGESFNVNDTKTRLVESGSVFADGSCSLDQLTNGSHSAASGKVVLCFSTMGMVSGGVAALAVYAAGGAGVIFAETISRRSTQDNLLLTVHVDLRQGTRILDYIRSSSRPPTVRISRSRTLIGRSPAPAVAYFSSRGPSSISPYILKPDITAPGVNILAAWPPKSSPTVIPLDKRSVTWNFDSGTSMSCPHVSGIVAVVRSVGALLIEMCSAASIWGSEQGNFSKARQARPSQETQVVLDQVKHLQIGQFENRIVTV